MSIDERILVTVLIVSITLVYILQFIFYSLYTTLAHEEQ